MLFVSQTLYDLTFSSGAVVCRFELVGYGTQPRGYFHLDDVTKYVKGIDVAPNTVHVKYAAEYAGDVNGTVMLTGVPSEVCDIFLQYGRLRGFMPRPQRITP